MTEHIILTGENLAFDTDWWMEYDDNWIYLDASYDSDDEKEVFEFLEKSLICKLNYQAMQEEFDGEVVE